MRLSFEAVLDTTSGRLTGLPAPDVVESVSTDSRTLVPGALFAAIRGDRDGHDFVADAFAAGAAAALVDHPVAAEGPQVVVPDTLEALTALGRYARERLGDRPVVGVTGSTGKTSTKDLCAGALGAARRVHASFASFNNELGVPLTLLGAHDDVEVVVVEMGARGAGHIAHLAALARPQVGVITGIGAAHTELFGSVEEVARAKGELFEALPPDGTAVVGDGHEWVDVVVRRSAAPVLVVGADPGADVCIEHLRVDSELRPRFELRSPWGTASVVLEEMRGAHQALNAALAATVAVVLGVDLEVAVEGLRSARGSRWRMELARSPAGVTVVNDAYNANPISTTAALEALAALATTGRRWAVLGEMAELGDHADAEHARVGALAAERRIDRVVVVGRSARLVGDVAREGGCVVDLVDDVDAATSLLLAAVEPGDAVLLKASRVVGLERTAEALLGVPHTEVPRLTDADVLGEAVEAGGADASEADGADAGPRHRGGASA